MNKNLFDFKNKTAVITGGAQGFGLDIAKRFLEGGAKVVIWDIDSKLLEKVLNNINNDNLTSNIVDVSNYKTVEDAVNKTLKNSNIDILINNAGITRDNILARMNLNQWNDVINTNLNGYFNCCKHIIKHMMKNKYGRIINISSIIGKNGNPGQINYSSSKAGLVGLTKSLSKEVGARNITVNSIAPGFIKTDMTKDLDESNKNNFLENISLKRFGNAKEVAELTTFLASDKASYITGQTINIDGGIY